MQLTIDYIFLSKVMLGKMIGYEKYFLLPPVRIELTTPGLRDQCSTTELHPLQLVVTGMSQIGVQLDWQGWPSGLRREI